MLPCNKIFIGIDHLELLPVTLHTRHVFCPEFHQVKSLHIFIILPKNVYSVNSLIPILEVLSMCYFLPYFAFCLDIICTMDLFLAKTNSAGHLVIILFLFTVQSYDVIPVILLQQVFLPASVHLSLPWPGMLPPLLQGDQPSFSSP